MRTLVLCLLSAPPAFLTVSWSVGQPGAEEHPTVKAARAREKAFKTVAVKFKITQVVAKGAASAHLPPIEKPAKAVPEKEITLESTNRLVYAGSKVRYENNHPTWLWPAGVLIRPGIVSIFDGTLAKELFPKGVGNNVRPQGFIIVKDRGPGFVRAFDLIPLNSTFRGTDPRFTGYAAGQLKPTNRTVEIDGAKCIEFAPAPTGRQPASTTAYYHDPKQGYVVRRVRSASNGRTTQQLDITYRRDKQHGWLPVSWVRTDYGPDGALLRTTRFTILDLRLNAPQAPEQFDIRFPPGTRVYDQRDNGWYLVQPNGELREDPTGGR